LQKLPFVFVVFFHPSFAVVGFPFFSQTFSLRRPLFFLFPLGSLFAVSRWDPAPNGLSPIFTELSPRVHTPPSEVPVLARCFCPFLFSPSGLHFCFNGFRLFPRLPVISPPPPFPPFFTALLPGSCLFRAVFLFASGVREVNSGFCAGLSPFPFFLF